MLQIVFPAPSRFCAIWPPAPRLFSLFSHDAALHLTPASADLVGYLYTQRIRVSLMMQTFGQMDCGGVWRCLEFTAEGRNAWNFQFLVPGKTAVGVLTPAAIWLPQVNSLLFFSCFCFFLVFFLCAPARIWSVARWWLSWNHPWIWSESELAELWTMHPPASSQTEAWLLFAVLFF